MTEKDHENLDMWRLFSTIAAQKCRSRFTFDAHRQIVYLYKYVMWSVLCITVIPRLTKIIRSGITFVNRNVISRRFL